MLGLVVFCLPIALVHQNRVTGDEPPRNPMISLHKILQGVASSPFAMQKSGKPVKLESQIVL